MRYNKRRKVPCALSYTLIILLLIDTVSACSPGGGGFGRRRPRKMTPLVFKQHIPNISETTFGASGQPEGRITRDDPRFKNLVVNYNPDIVFKDEEGTGADRIMTQRMKDKLNTLAIQVMNQWPGIKLRVTEAWDEDGMHAKDSLHYEGRAVDITTDDRKREKYGMLARLAVDAGFDWVYYESQGHIHCSVKSDTSIASNYGGCFPEESLVETSNRGTIAISQLHEGDEVLAMADDGSLTYSPVLLFFHQDAGTNGRYLNIQTSSQKSITITGNHLIHKSAELISKKKVQDILPTFAAKVEIGDYIYSIKNGSIHSDQVVNISLLNRQGMYAPLTKHGTIVVDGYVTSCYAYIDSHTIAHLCLAPMRLLHFIYETCVHIPCVADILHTIHNALVTFRYSNGVHWYADSLHFVSQFVIPKFLLFDT